MSSMSVAAAHTPFGLPFWLGLLVMFGIVVARAQLTYWAGRGVAHGIESSRLARRIGPQRLDRAHNFMSRYGPYAVTASFLTLGVQTAVNFAAGTTRMPFARYLVSMLIGSVIWAVIWTVGGLGVIWGAVELTSRAPYIAVGLGGVTAIAAAALLVRRRQRRGRREKVASMT